MGFGKPSGFQTQKELGFCERREEQAVGKSRA